MCPLNVPAELPARLDPDAAAALVRTVADIALILSPGGEVLDLALGNEGLSRELDGDWVGKAWVDTVAPESRPRIEALLREVAERGASEWRQVAHKSRQGRDIPVQYRALRLGEPREAAAAAPAVATVAVAGKGAGAGKKAGAGTGAAAVPESVPAPSGRILVVGRELQAVASLQQQLVDAQQALERDYWRFRQMETRYRLLFQSVSEAVLIVDGALRRVVEANPAAALLLGDTPPRIVGRPFPEGFEPESARAIEALLGGVFSSGRADSVSARRLHDAAELVVSASLLRQDESAQFVVRLSPMPAEPSGTALPENEAKLLKSVGAAPDAIVITDAEGRILAANRAFLTQVELAAEQQLRGQSLDRWLGRAGIDLNVLISTLRQHGTLRLFKTTLRGQYGTTVDVEISAAAVPNGERPCFGFFIRDVGRRLGTDHGPGTELPVWVGQFTERVGSAPLKDLVRESTDLIERLCIEAALKLTGGNRASAAELLGLSRQSLYVKLARYGIGGDAGEAE